MRGFSAHSYMVEGWEARWEVHLHVLMGDSVQALRNSDVMRFAVEV